MNKSDIKILIVDDEEDILDFVGYNLRKEGYQVITATNGFDAIDLATRLHPELIILDIMMPGMDGIETCERLRQYDDLRNTLITYFTARNEDYSQIAGYEAGADDYITKPIKPRLLVNKVAALLRRLEPQHTHSSIIGTGDLIVDLDQYKVFYKGQRFILPKKEFELLSLLISKPNRVFTREEIYSKVWGNDVLVGERTIDVYIRKIREKLGTRNIVTIKGVGYKYEDQPS
ncbi:MAG: response regulator transcription factor [Bacteroidales bacterium]|nr:response regulator transcription factor [Lentimicrobiaceae bacterium]MDD5695502.1 response regulator transcription factor [Bacteroidales bacterium]